MFRAIVYLSAACLYHHGAHSRILDQSPLHPLESSTTTTFQSDRHLFDFHKNLTQIESITYNEAEACRWLASSLRSQGYTVEEQAVGDKTLGRLNLYAYPGKDRITPILLSSHIDTVPPFYNYTHTNTTISGRGSVDDKASLAAQIAAVSNLLVSHKISREDIALLFVVGEETGGDGMRAANSLDLKPHTIIFGEPTEGKLASGHKGNLPLTLHAHGKAAHSGYPWLGRSANEVLVRALAALMELGPNLPQSEKYGVTTINIGKISGGVAANVVAETASASIAVRIAAGTPNTVQANITKAVHLAVATFLDDDDEGLTVDDIITLDFGAKGYGPVDIDHDIPGFETLTVNYGTDIPWLERAVEGQKRYLYGPGSISVAHSDHEALTEEELTGAVEGYERMILYALGREDD